MEQLLFYLKHLACPQFLLPRDDLIVSSRFRNNLLIWLHAVYSKPSLRIVQDESWTKHEGEPTDILKWIQLMGVGDQPQCQAYMHDEIDLKVAVEQTMILVEAVYGRVLVESKGDHEIFSRTNQILDDICTHQDSIFQDHCEIFPISIQLLTNQSITTAKDSNSREHFTKFKEDTIASNRQAEALENQIQNAQETLKSLQEILNIQNSTDNLEKDSKKLSQMLGNKLVELNTTMNDAIVLMENEILPWITQAKPHLIELGQSAARSKKLFEQVLTFFQNIKILAQGVKERHDLQKSQDILNCCQELLNKLSPILENQKIVLHP